MFEVTKLKQVLAWDFLSFAGTVKIFASLVSALSANVGSYVTVKTSDNELGRPKASTTAPRGTLIFNFEGPLLGVINAVYVLRSTGVWLEKVIVGREEPSAVT